MRHWLIIGFLLVLAGLSASPAQAIRQYEPNANIFRVKSSDCVQLSKGKVVLQTGFRVRGFPGIITALHGVVGCRTISAMAETGPFFNSLSIVQVDVDNDVALLSNPNQPFSADEGFERGDPYQLGNNDILNLVGFPETATASFRRRTQPPEIRSLESMLDVSTMAGPISNRNSPNVHIKVVAVQVNMMHGDSGAPLLDDQNMVNAIADGGWANGTVSIGWAIPFSQIHFQPVSAGNVQTRLQQLGNQNPADAPVFSATFNPGSVEPVTVNKPTPQSSTPSLSMRWRGTIRFMTGPEDEGKTFDYIFLYNDPQKLTGIKLYGDGLSTLFGNTNMQAITLYQSFQPDGKDYLHMLAPSSAVCEAASGSNVTPAVTSMKNTVSSFIDALGELAFQSGEHKLSQGAFQGEQTVQAINTRHYTFDPDILNTGNNNTTRFTYLSKDAWTASDDNRLIQIMTLAQVQSLKLGPQPFTGYVQLTGQFVDSDENLRNLSIPFPEECTSPGSKAQVQTDVNQAKDILAILNQAEIDVMKNGLSSKSLDFFGGLYRYELEDQVRDLIDQGLHENWEFDASKSYVRNVTAIGNSSFALNTCEYWRWQRKDAQNQIIDQSKDYPNYRLVPRTIISTDMDLGSGVHPYITDEYSYADKGLCK